MVASIFADGLFENVTCLITGGGSGIGLATAQLFYGLGAKVALLGRRQQPLEEAAASLGGNGERVLTHSCDIREPQRVEEAVEAVLRRLGAVDLLVNNAGGQFPSPAEAISPKGFEAVVRNNLLGTWNMTREVATKSMIPAGGGVIVNVIANIERGFPGMVHTGAARAGVDNMTKTLAIEWVRHKIRVNAVAPGIIATPAISKYPPDVLTFARRGIPMKRLGSAAEVASLIGYVASPAAAYITGETFYIDGGARLWGETWPIDDDANDEV